MPSVESHFSQSYLEARQKFLLAAEDARLSVQKILHPKLGRDGELLSTDVVRDGTADAKHLLIVSSACHGVEGFCGSGIQTAMLHDTQWRRVARESGVAVLYVHALNPFGFSWWRRTTHENVDLNRNFLDFSQPLPHNPAYAEIADILVPEEWPPSAEVVSAIKDFISRHGATAYQAAVSGGQYHHPDGLFYGGSNACWSNTTVRQILQAHASEVPSLAWIDIHTGLGPSGYGERIFGCRFNETTIKRAKSWWGDRVTLLDDGSSASSPLTGMLWHLPHEVCPQAQYTAIGLEFGTVAIGDMIEALRADQWLEKHPAAPEPLRATIKQQVRDAFYTDTLAWKEQVLRQAKEAAKQAVFGLSSSAADANGTLERGRVSAKGQA